MKKYSCDEIKALLYEYSDGETDAETARDIEEHLEGCPECRAELESCLKAKSAAAAAVGKDNIPSPPADLHDRIMSAVHKDAAAKKRQAARRWRNIAAAAAVLTLFVGIGAFVFMIGPMKSGNSSFDGLAGEAAAPGFKPDENGNAQDENQDEDIDRLPENMGGAEGETGSENPTASDSEDKYEELFRTYGAGYDRALIIPITARSYDAAASLAKSLGAKFDGQGFSVPYTKEAEDAVLSWSGGDVLEPVVYGDEGELCIIVYVEK